MDPLDAQGHLTDDSIELASYWLERWENPADCDEWPSDEDTGEKTKGDEEHQVPEIFCHTTVTPLLMYFTQRSFACCLALPPRKYHGSKRLWRL